MQLRYRQALLANIMLACARRAAGKLTLGEGKVSVSESHNILDLMLMTANSFFRAGLLSVSVLASAHRHGLMVLLYLY